MQSDLSNKQLAKLILGVSSATPVEYVELDDHRGAPTLTGEPGHYTTPGGEPVRHPNAYARKGRVVYHRNSLRIEASAAWFDAHPVRECLFNGSARWEFCGTRHSLTTRHKLDGELVMSVWRLTYCVTRAHGPAVFVERRRFHVVRGGRAFWSESDTVTLSSTVSRSAGVMLPFPLTRWHRADYDRRAIAAALLRLDGRTVHDRDVYLGLELDDELRDQNTAAELRA